jgi:hypothetical protein
MFGETSEVVGENEEDDQGENTNTSHEVEVPVDGDKHGDEMKQSFVLFVLFWFLSFYQLIDALMVD